MSVAPGALAPCLKPRLYITVRGDTMHRLQKSRHSTGVGPEHLHAPRTPNRVVWPVRASCCSTRGARKSSRWHRREATESARNDRRSGHPRRSPGPSHTPWPDRRPRVPPTNERRHLAVEGPWLEPALCHVGCCRTVWERFSGTARQSGLGRYEVIGPMAVVGNEPHDLAFDPNDVGPDPVVECWSSQGPRAVTQRSMLILVTR